ncbi:hypothetical protein UFOVP809_8 [uncultured Caudovirales phage]|uniref:Chlorovirus glycoprotein repeat domain-containing protein n=1 Tax=uncultured Caudovirales phage TaxID=2100421 RepID=A0A6J5QV89_9CAUD|nr:hypothetical protein UFOVP809_8 [uncultured Caudovirales phage]CAB4186506.1 hypothetical protein UFOVP1148_13 [uncultured Caudovirales phage]
MIKNLGGVFGRNPTFNNVEVEGDLTVDGSIIGPVVVDANTLTGTTLAANVVNSSLTSVGTLTSLTTSSNITFSEPNGPSLFGLGNGFDLTNVALGNALQNCTPDASTGDGQYNLGIGAGSLNAITIGISNTAVGANSLAYGQTCSQNIAIGNTAMGGNPATPQTGTYNIAIGNSSCNVLTTNTNVIGIGKNSFLYLASGNNSVAIGQLAGAYAINTSTFLTSTTNSIYIGQSSKASAASGNTNEIAIGSTALGLGSNTVVLGNTSITNTYLRGDINLAAGKKIIDATVQSLTSQNASGTGVSPTIQIICPSSATALTSGATAQNVFSPVGFDTIIVQDSTTYMFDGLYIIKTTGGVTHTISMSFALSGGASITNCSWTTMSYPLGTPLPVSAVRAQDGNFFAAVSGGAVNATNATAFNVVKFEGIMRVNAAGSVVPQITFSAAPTGTNTLEIGSYLRFYPIGSNTIDSVGTAIG